MKMGTSALLSLSAALPALHPWLGRVARELAARLGGTLGQTVRVQFTRVSEESPLALLARLEEAAYVRRLGLEGS